MKYHLTCVCVFQGFSNVSVCDIAAGLRHSLALTGSINGIHG